MNVMKKTALILLATIMVITALSGCFASRAPSNSPSSGSPAQSGSPSVTTPEKKDTFTAYFRFYRNPDSPYWNSLKAFRNGLTMNFVLFRHDEEGVGKIYLALMNQKGEILYKLDTGETPRSQNMMPEINIIGIGKNIVAFSFRDVYYVLSSSGREIANSNGGAFDRVLAVSDDMALVYKNNGSVSAVSQELGALDANGGWVSALSRQDIDIGNFGSARWLGESFFELKWNRRASDVTNIYDVNIFNAEEGVMSHTIEIHQEFDTVFKVSDFKSGTGYYLPHYPMYSSTASRELGKLVYSDGEFHDYYVFNPNAAIPYDLKFKHFDGVHAIFTGKIDGKSGDYFFVATPDKSEIGDEFLYFKDYPEHEYGVDQAGISSVESAGDYWAVEIIGADRKVYLTVYRHGEEEPIAKEICLGDSDSVSGVRWFRNETIFYWEKTNGVTKYVWLDLHGNRVNELTAEASWPWLDFQNDVEIIGEHYIDMNGRVILSELTDKSN